MAGIGQEYLVGLGVIPEVLGKRPNCARMFGVDRARVGGTPALLRSDADCSVPQFRNASIQVGEIFTASFGSRVHDSTAAQSSAEETTRIIGGVKAIYTLTDRRHRGSTIDIYQAASWNVDSRTDEFTLERLLPFGQTHERYILPMFETASLHDPERGKLSFSQSSNFSKSHFHQAVDSVSMTMPSAHFSIDFNSFLEANNIAAARTNKVISVNQIGNELLFVLQDAVKTTSFPLKANAPLFWTRARAELGISG